MPHLNELHTKYGPRGLVIAALTQSATDSFLKEHKIAYPVGIGGGSFAAYGVTGIPQVYLVGPDGRVVWEGHTSGLTEALIEQHLQQVVVFPEREQWPRVLEPAARAAQAGRLGEAWRKLERLGELQGEEAEAQAALRSYIERKAEAVRRAVEAAVAEGDYYAAQAELRAHERAFQGHPFGEQIEERLRAFKRDPEIQKAIRAGALFEQAQALEAQGDLRRALGYYAQAAKVGEGTKAGARARERAEALAAKLGR
ncbi:MAG: hypothetical protein KatS3mg102_0591 [Planctomycetota bacterium]|nr:MAG: hypothetical protein KatS3mg102_0591 [Planctomycetota bacterium]